MSNAKPSVHASSLPNGHTETIAQDRRLLLRGALLGLPALSAVLSGCGGAEAAGLSSDEAAAVTITTSPYAVAIVSKEASATLQLSEGIDQLISLMRQAKAGGASLMVCGELWLPGYPVALNFASDWKQTSWSRYVANSIVVGDANWQRILDAAQQIGLYVAFGFSELEGNYAYMSQALISDTGKVLLKRRKVRPSGSERLYWSDAPMAGNLQAVNTPLGRISMLECWDHLRPQSTFNVMAQLPNVHICAWPYIPATTSSTQWWERAEVAHTAAAYFSQLTGAYTLLPGVGHTGFYRNSVKLAEQLPEDAAAMMFVTVTPDNWSGATGSTTSEYSYGVLQLLADNYPGQKVADSDHGVLNMVPLS